MNVGRHHWEDNQDEIRNVIDRVEWQDVKPGLTLPMMPGELINEIIKQFKMPKVSHVCYAPDLAPYGLVGIRSHYKNADVDFFAVDEGHESVSLCAVVTDKEADHD